ncbi:hypothetical protein SmJEL517_g04586 [Synchytrium microbalum]|uniref:DUF202 domain-containing protein n=1 Tax=Synchytrium microbalum TaxID=1806994 RepID=A0A507BYU3_9FUNG|nr:uncharacterized protein SmJEL517_g04586 [Synchytrium microbalum]TPX32288.1 hypothetical protein SmJEL517_g04586 [Synchytrium microbalum]
MPHSPDDDTLLSRRGHLSFLQYFDPHDPRGKGKQPATSGSNTSGQLPVKIKNFLANERTFLSWAQFSLILGGLGIALVNGSSQIGQAAGVIFTLSTLIFLVYALWRFYERADRLQKRESGAAFEDKMGTRLIIIVVFFAVGANLIMKLVDLKGK